MFEPLKQMAQFNISDTKEIQAYRVTAITAKKTRLTQMTENANLSTSARREQTSRKTIIREIISQFSYYRLT